MSRVDDLVKSLAPKGVQFKRLGEVGEFIRGNGLQKSDLADDGVPAIHYGQLHTYYGIWTDSAKSFIDPSLASKLRRAREGDLVIATTSEDDRAVGKATAWLGRGEVAVSGDAYIYRHSLDPRYVAYFFHSEQFHAQKARHLTGTKVRRISGQALATLRIPVPPLDVQREVSRILDHFMELEAELNAELAARRGQYDYYRNQLLTFSDNAEWYELQQLFIMRNGYTPSKSDASLWADGTVPWFRMEDIRANGRVLDDAIQRIPESAVKGGRLFPANSILLATSATIGEHALITVPHLANQRFTSLTVQSRFADRLNVRFVHYYCFVLDEWCRNNTTVSSFASVDMAALKTFRFPVPTLSQQELIVDVLEKFDALVNDPSDGLPAEQRARRQQYEYYRDRLLAFPEVAA